MGRLAKYDSTTETWSIRIPKKDKIEIKIMIRKFLKKYEINRKAKK